MEDVLPIELVKNNFKTTIIKLQVTHKRQFVCFYEAETNYGKMTLIVQQFFAKKKEQNQKQVEKQIDQKMILQRNELLQKQEIIGPLIYEQEMKKIRENYFICLTLTQPIQLKKRQHLLQQHSVLAFENLVQCAYKISKTAFQYQSSCYLLDNVLCSYYEGSVFIDFTKTFRKQGKTDNAQLLQSQNFRIFKKELCKVIQAPRPGKMTEIIFIREKSVAFNVQALIKARNWLDLALMFNLLPSQKVKVLSDKKLRTMSIRKIQGCATIELLGQKYQNLNFDDGFRTDGLRQLTYETLKANFFQDKITYFMSKSRYQTVQKRCNSEQIWIRDNIQYTDLIVVKQQVSKAEFISFLIGYFRYIEPTLNMVRYIADQNALMIEYLNKNSKIKSVLIKFCSKYTVKDQEITMIIEKGRLKNTRVNLQKMQITDSCLMFLANCDKTLNITNFDISHCPNVSESGVQLMLSSPMCKNIRSLKIAGLTLPDFFAVKIKKELKQLCINKCNAYDEVVSVSDWKIEKLEALGLNISLDLPSMLKVLIIDTQLPLQNLKKLKNLSLTHLKLKIVESKKMMSNFFSAFYTKQNPVRIFAEGSSRSTLKIFDMSNSSVRLKELKPILNIQSLQHLVCQGIQKESFGDCYLPQHIVNLSFKGSHITFNLLSELLSRTGIIIKLNLCKTQVDDSSLQAFVRSKKYINFLQIQQEQLSLKLLQKRSGVDTVQIHIMKLVRDEHELILNKLLLTQAQTNKEMHLSCDQKLEAKLISKINRFTMFYESHLHKLMASNPNIFVNSIPIWKLFNYKAKQNRKQYIRVINQQTKPHRIKLYPSSLLSEAALAGTDVHMQTLNVFLHKTLITHPDSFLQICIRSNRVLNKEVIQMIRKYAGERVRSIDFRDCIFHFEDVREELYLFPVLECVNQGEYDISLNQDNNVQQQLQKLLKFFLKLKLNQKIKLTLRAEQVSQIQLFYTIIYEIIHQYSAHVVSLTLQFKNMKAKYSEIFWQYIFSLPKLQTFNLSYHNDNLNDPDNINLIEQFKNINSFHLFSLDITTNIPGLLPQYFSFMDLKKLHLDLQGQAMTDLNAWRYIKSLTSLTHLDLKLGHNDNLNSFKKVSDAIEKMHNLAHLAINLENCPLKEHQIFQFVYCLQKNKHLQRFEFNINNIPVAIPELVKFCQLLQKHNKYCHILVYALQNKKQLLHRDQNELLAKGIEIIHAESIL